MKFSIITVSYNAASTIRHTIHSVLGQEAVELEYIIVDGHSKDGTSEIIQEFNASIHHFISEPDAGIYDAMNKGIRLASGDYIGILNADDIFAYPRYLADVATLVEQTGAPMVYSNLTYVAGNGNTPVRHWKAGAYKPGAFRLGWMPPHPTTIMHRQVYDVAGVFNLDFRLSADYEFLLRAIEKHAFVPAYLNKTGVYMRLGGVSNSNINNRIRANREDVMAWEVNGLKRPPLLRYLKPGRKVLQYLFALQRSPDLPIF